MRHPQSLRQNEPQFNYVALADSPLLLDMCDCEPTLIADGRTADLSLIRIWESVPPEAAPVVLCREHSTG